jgi:putative FmdB family regulatory protein
MAREDAWEMPQGFIDERPLLEILVSGRTHQGFRKMTYEYLCSECQHAWEEEQSISAAPSETCPNCGRKSAKRQVSGGVGFILKGGGWYADGYGSGASKKSEPSAEKSGDKGSSTGSGSSGTSSTKSGSTSGDSKSSDAAKGDSGKGGSGDSAASPPA